MAAGAVIGGWGSKAGAFGYRELLSERFEEFTEGLGCGGGFDGSRKKNNDSSKIWMADEVTFVEVELDYPSERQLRIEFESGVRLLIADESQFPLAAKLIHFIRRSEEVSS